MRTQRKSYIFCPKTIVQLESRETISGEAVLCSFVLSSECAVQAWVVSSPSAVLLSPTLCCATFCCYPLPSAMLLRTISGKAPPCPAPVHCPLLLVLLRCRDLLTVLAFLIFFFTFSNCFFIIFFLLFHYLPFYICFIFPHCVFSNVLEKCLPASSTQAATYRDMF